VKEILIVGTDTGVGKTIVTTGLGRFLYKKGIKVGIGKLVATGGEGDLNFFYKIGEIPKERIFFVYLFKFPASPHLSAEIEKSEIKIKKIKEKYQKVKKNYEIIITEGVGGILVPLTRNYLLIELIQEIDIPALIVARSTMGTINHTLLTIEALKNRRIKIVGVILNSIEKEKKIIIEDNVKIIKKLGKVEVFGVVPYFKEVKNAVEWVERNIAGKIYEFDRER
jgi:dethiobiotin synthetase